MIRDEFFKDKNGYLALTGSTRKNFDAMWCAVQRFEKDFDLSVDNWLGKDEYQKLFSYFAPGATATFKKKIQLFKFYLQYLEKMGCIPERGAEFACKHAVDAFNATESVSITYHPTLKELYEDIETSILLCGDYDEHARDREAVFLYLAWFGLTEQEILNFKKSDVLESKIVIHGTPIDVPPYVMSMFHNLKYSDGFSVLRRQETFNSYYPSPYMMRSSAGQQITLPVMRKLVSDFNIAGDKRYGLTYKKVYQSGVFHRAYVAESSSEFALNLKDYAVASKLFEVDISSRLALNNKLRDYANFKAVLMAYLN